MNKHQEDLSKAVEELIAEYLKSFNIELVVTASSLRYPPGLLEAEKIAFAKKIILSAARDISEEEITRHANSVDDLINFALDNRLLYAAMDLIKGFGAEPETIMRILQFMKRWAKGQDSSEIRSFFMPRVLQILGNNERSEETVNFAITWSLELGYTEYAVQLGDLRKKPGLTKNELETLLAEHISNGDIVESKAILVLLDREFLIKEIRRLKQSAELI